MLLTNLFSRGIDEVVVRRAPRGKIYFVEAMNITAQTISLASTIYVLNRHMKPSSNPVLGGIGTNTTFKILGAAKFGQSGTPQSHWIGQINEKTKYISMAYENSNNLVPMVQIYGQIINASKSDLIWEFITKRHR